MLSTEETVSLEDLNYNEYLDAEGKIDPDLEGKISIYAIFDRDKKIKYIGYSRNLFKSLQQHLVRKVDQCYWFKAHIIYVPSRSILDGIRHSWITANEDVLPDNEEQKQWTQAIDIRTEMTDADKHEYEQQDELHQIKLLKKVARRVEEIIRE